MAFELKENQGSLFINEKDGVEKRPDRQGRINIKGVIYRLSGWLKEGANGPWLSLEATAVTDIPIKAAPAADDPDNPF